MTLRRLLSASTIGTALEWYDFFLYGTAAALVFNKVFFPDNDPRLGVLASLATFAVGLFARPFGGLIFAHFGDRYGRRDVLLASLCLMGAASTLIGVIPSYRSIGIAAPVFLVCLRILQGLGAGAEYAGATLMAAEHAPQHRRGLFAAVPVVGTAMGTLLASAIFTPFTLLPEEALLTWGWRVPFLVSVAVAGVGIYIRVKIEESPVFIERRQKGATERVPFLTVLRDQPRTFGLAILLGVGPNVATYIPLVYALTYITENVGISGSVGTTGLLVVSAIRVVVIPLAGAVSDRLGRKPVFLAGGIACAAFSFPFFWLLDTGVTALVWFALFFVASLCNDAMLGSQASLLAEQFDTSVRYTGIAFSREIAAALVGGTLPVIAAGLSDVAKGTWAISLLMAVLCLAAAAAALGMRRPQGLTLTEREPAVASDS